VGLRAETSAPQSFGLHNGTGLIEASSFDQRTVTTAFLRRLLYDTASWFVHLPCVCF